MSGKSFLDYFTAEERALGVREAIKRRAKRHAEKEYRNSPQYMCAQDGHPFFGHDDVRNAKCYCGEQSYVEERGGYEKTDRERHF